MQLKLYVVVSMLAITASLALNLEAEMKIPHASHSATIRDHRQIDASLSTDAMIASAAETTTNSLAQTSDEDKSLKARLFKWINMGLDAVYGMGCKFTNCLEP